jgi:hypothetical protein
MGKVFTVNEIANGDIPEVGAHYEAGQHFLGELFDHTPPRNENGRGYFHPRYHAVDSVMVYGSTALGLANVRSDLDVLVNFCESRSLHEQPVDECFSIIGSLIRTTQDKYKVPVQANILPHMWLWNPLKHNVDILFAQHLVRVQNMDDPQWSFGFPADGLVHNRDTNNRTPDRIRAFAIRYTAAKARQMAKALTLYTEVDHHTLQRALELPSALGRKIVALADATKPELAQAFEEVDGRDASFQGFVLAAASVEWHRDYGRDTSLLDMLSLKQKDEEYSELLDSTISGSTTLEDYQTWLEDQYRPTLQLAYRIAHDWTSLLSDRLDVRDQEAEEVELERRLAAIEDVDIY